MQWLDLARYADTHGYHIDSQRDMWQWRDWVIDAFNRNMPFDQFTHRATRRRPAAQRHASQQKLATGFNRNHMINYEGGAIPEEYQVEYVVDRVDTTANVFMGLTMGCARCHDHKYDPISQKDFYRFFAFFNTIPEKGLDGKSGNAAPMLEMPTAEQASEVGVAAAGHRGARSGAAREGDASRCWPRGRRRASRHCRSLRATACSRSTTFDGNLADTSGNHRDGTHREGQGDVHRRTARAIGRLQRRSAARVSRLSRPTASRWRSGCAAARSAK